MYLNIAQASQVVLVVKKLTVNAGDIRDTGSIPGSGRSPGGWHDSPLQYSCLENSMDRGTCRAIVHRVTKSQTRLKWLSTQHTCTYVFEHSESLSLFPSYYLWHVPCHPFPDFCLREVTVTFIDDFCAVYYIMLSTWIIISSTVTW